ncbi:unnamed protein product [Darwinula stevensoni]|uniref:FYVE-type domain-containing protein n=1 Tax=Darwinula stevensoni TaxID=69355 RepID=A0A7R8XCR7_9CRUS|nr:unnamed protein product [Darwinula stevensoni]CAG0892800.1 unnamed protein product [Darwinula stevensoni]
MEKGDLDVLGMLLAAPGVDLNVKAANGESPLWIALMRGDLSAAGELIRCGAAVDHTLVFVCATRGMEDVALFLLRNGAPCRYVRENPEENALEVAAARGQVRLLEELLKGGAEAFRGNPAGECALHVAIREGQEDAANRILQIGLDGSDLTAFSEQSKSLLGLAVKNSMFAIADELVSRGARLDPSLVEAALRDKNEKAALYLIEKGESAEVVSSGALCLAVEGGLAVAVDALCRKGIPLGNIEEPLWLSLQRGFFQVASALLAHKTGDEKVAEKLLPLAIREGREEAACFLVQHVVDVDSVNGGESPLQLACEKGLLEVVQILLACGADVNLTGRDGETALHKAVNIGDGDLVNILIQHPGMNSNAKDRRGRTPLGLAIAAGNKDIAQSIVDLSPHLLEEYDGRGRTHLHDVVARGDLAGLLFLLALNVDVNKPTGDAERLFPLHLSVMAETNSQTESIVRHLLLAGADPNARSARHLTPLHLSTGAPGILEALLDGGADAMATDDEHDTVLHVAMKQGRLSAIRILLRVPGIDPWAVNLRGHTPLHTLARYGADNAGAILDALLSSFRSYPIDQQDLGGNTALLLAYMRGHVGICKTLVSAGAALATYNRDGMNIFNFQLPTRSLLHRLLDSLTQEPPWVDSDSCMECGSRFSITTRKHHCRHCGRVLCRKCSDKEVAILKFGLQKPVRICAVCYKTLTQGI